MRSITTESRIGLRALALGFLAVVLAGAVLLLFEGEAVGASGGTEVKVVRVESGDTLWEIAHRFAPGEADLRVVVQEIVVLNGLESKVLRPGQTIRIPDYRF